MARAALDTSVIIEYIDKAGLYHEQAALVFSAALSGRLELVIPHPVLVETYYVAAHVYERLGLEDPKGRVARLVGWLYRLPSVRVVGADLRLALEAGVTKLRYRLALTDCYVLAAAKVYKCRPLFRKREKEMKDLEEELKRDYGVLFLEDYA